MLTIILRKLINSNFGAHQAVKEIAEAFEMTRQC